MFRFSNLRSLQLKYSLRYLKVSPSLRTFVFQNYQYLTRIRDNVAMSLSKNQPVVALESTIITHGLPYPENFRTAMSVEKIIKENGAIPATIGIKNGELIIGMNEDEIKYLAEKKDNVVKTSRRDLSYVLSKGLSGGTTVAATMLVANMAGIDVFVTGGIGGVHRDATETFDISADLTELSKTPVAVICSGVKSILDIGLTLEYLETQGVPVLTYGSSKYFPAFFTARSKFQSPYNSESTAEIARMIYNQFSMNLQNGLVIGVPIPSDDSTTGEEIEEVIQDALTKAKLSGVIGKEITPFVLKHIVELTKGSSLTSNVKLIENNAKVGAQISVELSKLKSKTKVSNPAQKDNTNVYHQQNKKKKRPVVIGGSIFDIKATIDKISDIAEATNLGKIHTSLGGVGRNIAECLGRLGTNPLLISSVGKDFQGEMLLNQMEKSGMDISAISIVDNTPSYSIVANNSGELIVAVGDTEKHDGITLDTISKFEDSIRDAAIVVVDGNISESSLIAALKLCYKYNVPTWFDPTTLSKAIRPFQKYNDINITYVSPNICELKAIHGVLKTEKEKLKNIDVECDQDILIRECLYLSEDCIGSIENLVITLGENGVLVVSKKPGDAIFSSKSGKIYNTTKISRSVLHYPAANQALLPVSVKSVSGAGDSFNAGVIYGFLQNYDTDTCIKGGLLAAYKSLHTYFAISTEINPQSFTYENIHKWANFTANVIK